MIWIAVTLYIVLLAGIWDVITVLKRIERNTRKDEEEPTESV